MKTYQAAEQVWNLFKNNVNVFEKKGKYKNGSSGRHGGRVHYMPVLGSGTPPMTSHGGNATHHTADLCHVHVHFTFGSTYND